MAEYKGKKGRWVTTKEGKHLFIEGAEEPKKISGANAALSKRRATKRTNDILHKYQFTPNRKPDDIDAKGLYNALYDFYAENNGSAVGHKIEDKDGVLYIDGESKFQFDKSDTLGRKLQRGTAKPGEPDYEAKQLDKQDNEAEPKKETEKVESDQGKKVEDAVQGRIINEYANDILNGKWEHRGGTHGWGIQHGDENELVAYMADGQWRLKHIGKDTTMMLEPPVKTDKFLVFSEAMKEAAKQAKQANASPRVKQALDTLDKVLAVYSDDGDVLTAGFYTDFLKLVQEQKDEILLTMT